MKIEIHCAHPRIKRKDYGDGWICEPDRGGCGATGHEETAHYNPVVGYFYLPDGIIPQIGEMGK